MIRDVMVLDPRNFVAERYAPFDALNLRDEIAALYNGDTLDRYSAEILYSAIGGD